MAGARVFAACPKLAMLATSREPLGLVAESRYPVSPLALPPLGTNDDPETLASVRVRATRPRAVGLAGTIRSGLSIPPASERTD